MSLSAEVEIVDFYQPLENNKNLFVTDIIAADKFDPPLIEEQLYSVCSKFGLLYEIQLFPVLTTKSFLQSSSAAESSGHSRQTVANVTNTNNAASSGSSRCEVSCNSGSRNWMSGRSKFYAFVKYYSATAARKAKKNLHLSCFVGTEPCKVKFAQRKKSASKEELHYSKCLDLANHYLGFNGWSSSIESLKRDDLKLAEEEGKHMCRFHCVVTLTLMQHKLTSRGIGIKEEDWPETFDVSMKAGIMARCRKRAVHLATINAFSKVLLVIVGGCKVYPEINTTQVDPLTHLDTSHHKDLIMVNEVEHEYIDSDNDETKEEWNEDALNAILLSELEAEGDLDFSCRN